MENGTRPESMPTAEALEVLVRPASYADRSLYLSCIACGALVFRRDERTHGQHHQALAVLAAAVLGRPT